jgi:hypothetical protein
MSETKAQNEGRVNVALGPVKLAELARLAKKHGTSRGALARAFILEGIDRIKSGQIEVAAGVNLNPKQP